MIELVGFNIKNFKSLNDFNLEFKKFSCLIGLNSSGKSTILHAVDFISQQMNGDITKWLESRGWEAEELECEFTKDEKIIIAISFFYENKFYVWTFIFDTKLQRSIYEVIRIINFKDRKQDKIIYEIKDSKYMILDLKTEKKLEGDIIQEYQGSFLSSIKEEFLPEIIREFKHYLQNIQSLDLLSPRELRKHSKDGRSLGLSGENLSAFLDDFSDEQKKKILKQLKIYYPNLNSFNIKPTPEGLKKLEIIENFGDKKITNEAKYINDGMLRLIAIMAQLQTQKKSFLLFDEIENGINSELVEFLMDYLVASKHQIMITTHSPMILNYLEDEVAKESVQYIYKTKEGFTKSIPFFDIPSMKEKLEWMGTGSVYVDTDLPSLADEIKNIKPKENK